MSPAIAILVCLTIPHSDCAEYRCDVVEVNLVVDNNGCPRLEQVIWRDLTPSQVRDWRMTNKCGVPTYDYGRGCWVNRWVEGGVTVEVKSASVLYSVCEEDRELTEREWLPEERRRRINR